VFNKAYLTTGLAVIAFYAVAAFNGWEFGTPPQEQVPADVRSSPGGYRSFHFWHSGFRGGK